MSKYIDCKLSDSQSGNYHYSFRVNPLYSPLEEILKSIKIMDKSLSNEYQHIVISSTHSVDPIAVMNRYLKVADENIDILVNYHSLRNTLEIQEMKNNMIEIKEQLREIKDILMYQPNSAVYQKAKEDFESRI